MDGDKEDQKKQHKKEILVQVRHPCLTDAQFLFSLKGYLKRSRPGETFHNGQWSPRDVVRSVTLTFSSQGFVRVTFSSRGCPYQTCPCLVRSLLWKYKIQVPALGNMYVCIRERTRLSDTVS